MLVELEVRELSLPEPLDDEELPELSDDVDVDGAESLDEELDESDDEDEFDEEPVEVFAVPLSLRA
ncbi:MAG: hypothetical protein O2826_02240 [Chloroflexi bacterium]|nr:hypothetical protein [Chloroflexota bacterium]